MLKNLIDKDTKNFLLFMPRFINKTWKQNIFSYWIKNILITQKYYKRTSKLIYGHNNQQKIIKPLT